MTDVPRTQNPILRLRDAGQSVWLDYIRRRMLEDGELERLIAEDALAGMTSNPAIFEQAIGGSDDYDAAIATLAREGRQAQEIYAALTHADIARAADLFGPVYERSGGRDGYVSLEVSPHLARDAAGTVAEAKVLWRELDRANVMIKVPGTRAGLAAIEQLIAAGVNVNVTLLFSVTRYREVAAAYIAGLEARVAAGLPIDGVASVASFFLSRIDTLVDSQLDARADSQAGTLRGRSAIACARLAYAAWGEIHAGERWRKLSAAGARRQRLLWASTGTKDAAYSDVLYVEELIGPDTVNTMPPQTMAAFRDHGRVAVTLERDLDVAQAVPGRLRTLGIDLDAVAERLEEEGIEKFVAPYDKLLATIEDRRRRIGH
ncbi:MAG: transaldolase [Gammaproteobacteria bacterium]|nr:transaldolase [Gammaproteobacteria bacterium]